MFSRMIIQSCIFVVFCFVFYGPGAAHGSAIPMWEFLSREEKMSFLYSMFANQVEGFCETSALGNCNRELLKYGLNRLKGMPDELLDALDPYQREADNMIWNALMSRHPLAKTTRRPGSSTSTTAKPNSYEDESFSDIDFSFQTAASAKVDNVYRLLPPKGFVPRVDPSVEDVRVTYPQITDVLTEKKGVFTKFQGGDATYSTSEKALEYPDLPLTGPMEVRVYPDGTPVKENRPLPQDEDLRQYKLSKIKIPTL